MSRNFVATVKETGDGQPWLMVEAYEAIGLSERQIISLELKEGTSIEAARGVAEFLTGISKRSNLKTFDPQGGRDSQIRPQSG